jgi:hypothetical protein
MRPSVFKFWQTAKNLIDSCDINLTIVLAFRRPSSSSAKVSPAAIIIVDLLSMKFRNVDLSANFMRLAHTGVSTPSALASNR